MQFRAGLREVLTMALQRLAGLHRAAPILSGELCVFKLITHGSIGRKARDTYYIALHARWDLPPVWGVMN